MPKGARKNKFISQAKKWKICELIDLGSKKTQVAAKFKLNESTVRAIYKRYLIEKGTNTAAGNDARQLGKQQLLTAKQQEPPADSLTIGDNSGSSHLDESDEDLMNEEYTVFAPCHVDSSAPNFDGVNLDGNNVAINEENVDPQNEVDEHIGPGSAVEELNRTTINQISFSKESSDPANKNIRILSWTVHQTTELALLMENHIHSLKMKRVKPSVIYSQVAKQMQECFPRVTTEMVKKRWSGLVNQYGISKRSKNEKSFKPYPAVVLNIVASFHNSLIPRYQENREGSPSTDFSIQLSDSVEEAGLDKNCVVQPNRDLSVAGMDSVEYGSLMSHAEAVPSSFLSDPASRTTKKDSLTQNMEQVLEKVDYLYNEIINENREMRSMLKQMLEMRREENEREKELHELTLEIKKEQLKILREKTALPDSSHSDIDETFL